MTTYKFHYRPPGRNDEGFGVLFIRVIHKRRYKDLLRGYRIYPSEWDGKARTLVLPGSKDPLRHRRLLEIQDSMLADISRMDSVITRLVASGDYSVNDIAGEFRDTGNGNTLLSFTANVSRRLIADGRHRTARAYNSAARSLVRFTGGLDIQLYEIRQGLIRSFERHLLDRGLHMNTISFYMRNLRAIYYRAVRADLVCRLETNPFENVFTGVHQTRRRALCQGDMRALGRLEKTLGHGDGETRNALLYFMFAYHSRGMSFIDLAHLKKSDIKGDTLIYKRRKTGFYMEVKVTKPMKKIIDHFRPATSSSPYVFPLLNPGGHGNRVQYEYALNVQNRRLKRIAALAGIGSNLSTHVSRHTWATLAKRMGYGVSLISEGLGHRDTKVTSIYLASFERSAMDEISTRLSKAVCVA